MSKIEIRTILLLAFIIVACFVIPSHSHEHYTITLTQVASDIVELDNHSTYTYELVHSHMLVHHITHPAIGIVVNYYDKDGDFISAEDLSHCNDIACGIVLKSNQPVRIQLNRPANAAYCKYRYTTTASLSSRVGDAPDWARFVELQVSSHQRQSPSDVRKEDEGEDYEIYMNKVKNGLIK